MPDTSIKLQDAIDSCPSAHNTRLCHHRLGYAPHFRSSAAPERSTFSHTGPRKLTPWAALAVHGDFYCPDSRDLLFPAWVGLGSRALQVQWEWLLELMQLAQHHCRASSNHSCITCVSEGGQRERLHFHISLPPSVVQLRLRFYIYPPPACAACTPSDAALLRSRLHLALSFCTSCRREPTGAPESLAIAKEEIGEATQHMR